MNGKKLKILLVDDDDLSRRMLSLLISGEGYDYETASNGKEAVEAVQTGKFNFVLMDLQMPYMSGYEATSTIRAWEAETGQKHTPVIALTAMLFKEEKQLCLNAGMDDCVMKPFNTTELFQMIDKYAGGTEIVSVNTAEPDSLITKSANILDVQTALPRFGSDFQVYQEFLNEFLESLPDRMSEMQELFDGKHFKPLTDKAHNLKGVAANMGAMQLSSLALKLEELSQTEDAQSIEEILNKINSMIIELQETSADFLLEFTG